MSREVILPSFVVGGYVGLMMGVSVLHITKLINPMAAYAMASLRFMGFGQHRKQIG